MKRTNGVALFLAGLFFSILWPSASSATKIGLQFAQPFIICEFRFLLAGSVMFIITHLLLKNRFPHKSEWKQLAIYGFLNISVYLGLFILAMQYLSAGLGSMATATNPVFISLIASLFLGYKIKWVALLSLILCTAGVIVAAYPLFQSSHATPFGVVLLLTSMITYSVGVLYFSRRKWNDLHILTINCWQTLLGGLFLLPLAIIFYKPSANHWSLQLAGAVTWLAIPVSIVAVQLWLFLLKDNAVKASFWLFLCPVFGFVMANVLMKEPVGAYTIAGVLLVLSGLYLVQRKKEPS